MQFYGLKTCDTCRKALKSLTAAGHDVTVTDVRADGLEPSQIAEIVSQFGDRAINRASTTWRNLDETTRARPAEALLAEHPTLMKRPVIAQGGDWTIGWARDVQAKWLGSGD